MRKSKIFKQPTFKIIDNNMQPKTNQPKVRRTKKMRIDQRRVDELIKTISDQVLIQKLQLRSTLMNIVYNNPKYYTTYQTAKRNLDIVNNDISKYLKLN